MYRLRHIDTRVGWNILWRCYRCCGFFRLLLMGCGRLLEALKWPQMWKLLRRASATSGRKSTRPQTCDWAHLESGLRNRAINRYAPFECDCVIGAFGSEGRLLTARGHSSKGSLWNPIKSLVVPCLHPNANTVQSERWYYWITDSTTHGLLYSSTNSYSRIIHELLRA